MNKNIIFCCVALATLTGISGCQSKPIIKIVNVPDRIELMHTTTVDNARKSLAVGGAEVRYDNSIQFTILMPDRLTFNKDGTAVSAWQQTYLNKLISVLNGPNIASIKIGSHYDNNFGVFLSDKYSQQYAYAFTDYLTRNGLKAKDVSVKSFGTREPLSHNENIYGNDKNKRIELIVLLNEPENVQTEKDYQKFNAEKDKVRTIKNQDAGNEIKERRIERVKNPL